MNKLDFDGEVGVFNDEDLEILETFSVFIGWGKNCTRAEICRNFKIPTFFSRVFTGNLREIPTISTNLYRKFLKFLKISVLVQFLPQGDKLKGKTF